MKKRSLSNLALLTLFTLGFYELVWLAQTRKEMIAKYKVKIPSIGYVVLVKTTFFVAFWVAVAIVFYFIPANNRAIDNFEKTKSEPAASCFAQYNSNSQCRQQLDNYFTQPPDDSIQLFGLLVLMFIAAPIINWLYLSRWVVRYAEAAQKATGQKLVGTMSVLAVGGVLPLIGMLNVQDSFNKISVK